MSNNRDGVPLVALDVDGTLGDYHAHFLQFAENWFGQDFPKPDQINPGLRLSEFMGVQHEDYRKCKLAFRQGGQKRWMPAYPGTSQLTREIRGMGVDIWICTTRPFDRLDNIDPDTREWLSRNGVLYDAMLFGEDKYHELWRQVEERRTVLAVVDDLPEMCTEAMQYNWPVLLRDQPYNRHFQPPGIRRVHNWVEILNHIKFQLAWLKKGLQ